MNYYEQKRLYLDRDLTQSELVTIAPHLAKIHGNILVVGDQSPNSEQFFILNPKFVLELKQLIKYDDLDQDYDNLEGDTKIILRSNPDAQIMSSFLGQDVSKFALSQGNIRQIYGHIIKNSRLPENKAEIEKLYKDIKDQDTNVVFDKISNEDIEEKLQYVKKEYGQYCKKFEHKSKILIEDNIATKGDICNEESSSEIQKLIYQTNIGSLNNNLKQDDSLVPESDDGQQPGTQTQSSEYSRPLDNINDKDKEIF